jgi:flagella basal body P-ring formation protein FlgA
MTKYLLSLILSVAFLTQPLRAESLQSLSEIEQSAFVFAASEAQTNYVNPQIIVESLDKRLRLQHCDAPLQAFSNSSANTLGNRTVGVRCNAPTEWTVYVPIRVKVMREVVVAARTLAANKTLTKADLKLQLMDIADLRQGFLASPAQALGKQLKYPIAIGTVLPTRGLKQVKVVRRGEQITLVASAGSMEVRMHGTAMADASVGEKVKVKNSSSKRVVEGVVEAPGIVKVLM